MSVEHTLHVRSTQQSYGGRAYLVKVHPLALFNIVDHYSRRDPKLPRVVGTLLGQFNDGIVNITNSYAVLHREKPLAFGTPSNQQMYKMHRAVNPNEIMLGWYATTIAANDMKNAGSDEPEINLASVALHQRYVEEIKLEGRGQTIHLVVDTTLQNDQISVKAYVASPVPLGSFGEKCYSFKEIEVQIASSPAEKFAIHSITQSTVEGNGQSYADVAPMASDIDFLKDALQKLMAMLDQTLDYVSAVVKDPQKGDDVIGYSISQALSSIPRIDSAAYEKTFVGSSKDIEMVQKLIALVEDQLKIASPLVVAR